MADMPSGFWAGWIATVTIVTLIALAWLVWSVYFSGNGEAAEEIWDETLREGAAPAPLWWFWFILALLAVTVVYLVLYPGLGAHRGVLRWSQGGRIAASAEHYEQEFGDLRSAVSSADAVALRDSALAMSAGESVFKNHCAACHGENARGQAELFPDLKDASWQWGGTEDALKQSIVQGRMAVMPPWQAVLGDEGVAHVSDYVLSLSAGSNPPSSDGSSDTTEGARLYQLYCTACHGADGSGLAALGAPALNDDVWLYGRSRDAVRNSIALGRTGEMPAFGTRLDTVQIKLLVAWLAPNESP